MPLSDLDCRHAKPKEKAYRLFDGGGLYLDVKPTGKRIWRLKYKLHGKEKLLTIGPYPAVALAKARNHVEKAKEDLLAGIDPCQQKQEHKQQAWFKQAQTFELVAREWHAYNYSTWSPKHAGHILSRLTQNVFPHIGTLPVSAVTVQDLLACLRKVEERECYHLARRILQIMGQVLRYAVVSGRAERDITTDLKGALKKYKKGHYAAIDADQLPEFLATVHKNEARLFKQTVLALRLMLLTFVRTSELINATWDEFDLDNAMWVIPPERMKMRTPHQVPLSHQVLAILSDLKETYGNEGYILPSVVRRNQPISNNTILTALARLGYKKAMTGHGFRALAMSTIKEKLGYRHEVVDRQLAHLPRNAVDQAYDRAMFLSERKKMMQEWADYISILSVDGVR